jgi:SAM-dependent methyltransferase
MPSLIDFTNEWNKYELKVDTDRGPIVVKWNDADSLARWANIQAGLYLQKTNSLQTFYEYFPKWYQLFWNARFKQGAFALADDAVILDIGSGVAVVDLLLASYLPKSKFYLLDQEGFEFQSGIYYDADYPIYHNWDPVVDAISASGLDQNRFVFLNPKNVWPEQVDAITSYFSYCFHYPKEKYWANILSSLKIGGKLILDVRMLADRDVVEEITEDMKCQPTVHWFDSKLPSHVDNMPSPKEGMPVGGRFIWTRKK